MTYYKDLREFVELLERRGALYRYKDPIDKNTELIPFHRVQMRGLPDEKRMAILFEKPVGIGGRSYGDLKVLVGVYAASERLLAWALGVDTYSEAIERFAQALDRPIPPVIVNDGPVHEEVHTGEELKRLGLDEFPIPVEEVGYSGMIRFGLPVLTKDPDTGTINIGTYNQFVRARDRTAFGVSYFRAAVNQHYYKHLAKGEPTPVAIIAGPLPSLMAASSAEIPYGKPGLDEYTVAGGIAGEPLQLVRCKTVPLEVPAAAEIVVEGYIDPDVMEQRTPFGEYMGYMAVGKSFLPTVRVTAITHRKGAMFTDVIVGMWPSDCNVVWGFAHSALTYHHLKYQNRLPVEEVHYPQHGTAHHICLIRASGGTSQEMVKKILETAANGPVRSRYIIALDDDIDLRDDENILWSLATRTMPHEDLNVVMTPGRRVGGFDPMMSPLGSADGSFTVAPPPSGPAPKETSLVLINATRKWGYPPVALPKKEYMEKAIALWKARGLPEPKMRWPWHGYELGYWTEDMKEYADLMAKGDWLAVGEKTEKLQKQIDRKEMLARRTAQSG